MTTYRIPALLMLLGLAGCNPNTDPISLEDSPLTTTRALAPGAEFRLMSYNIKGAIGCNNSDCTTGVRLKDFADTIVAEQPDVVSLQEIWQWSVGDLTGRKEFAGKDWYVRGARHLIGAQQADGKWVDQTAFPPRDILGTCYALLFLKRATPPTVTFSER